ncbi:MAG TPA: apolipoprotein N-acyltransferase [Proteobacteria bacterium]|nr:apolipoprotein N-acyltransferase [Pseudomonadota bacterium]
MILFIFLSAAALSSLLFYLAFTSTPYSWVWAFGAFLPWLAMLRHHHLTRKQAGALGLLSGFTFYFIELYWVTNSIAGFTNLPSGLVMFLMILLALYMGIWPALFTSFWHWLSRHRDLDSGPASISAVLTGAAAWLLLEELRALFLGGFPWHPLGLTQLDNPLAAALYAGGGIRLLSALVVAGNLSLYFGLVFLRKKAYFGLVLHLLFAAALIAAPGLLSDKNDPHPRSSSTGSGLSSATLRLVVLQPNIAQKDKWRPQNRAAIIEKMLRLTEDSLTFRPDLVIWPEASLPLLLEPESAVFTRLEKLVRDKRFSLMLGAPRSPARAFGEPPKLYNSIFLFSPAGVQVYDKIKLVPYGEFTPLTTLFPFIGKLVPGLDYSAGRKQTNFTLELAGNPEAPGKTIKIAPSVCFEGVFPAFTANFFNQGADLLVNLTNDAWFGDSPGPRQHLKNLRPRALENNCYIVRCAITGISAIITPQGQLEQCLELNREGSLEAVIQLEKQPTFFTRHPRLPVLIAGLMLLFPGFRAARDLRRAFFAPAAKSDENRTRKTIPDGRDKPSPPADRHETRA